MGAAVQGDSLQRIIHLDSGELRAALDALEGGFSCNPSFPVPPWFRYLRYLGGREGTGATLPTDVKQRLRREGHYVPAFATVYVGPFALLRAFAAAPLEAIDRIRAQLQERNVVFFLRVHEAFLAASYGAALSTYAVPKLTESRWAMFRELIARAHADGRVVFSCEYRRADAARRLVRAVGLSRPVSEALYADLELATMIASPPLIPAVFARHGVDVDVWYKGVLR